MKTKVYIKEIISCSDCPHKRDGTNVYWCFLDNMSSIQKYVEDNTLPDWCSLEDLVKEKL